MSFLESSMPFATNRHWADSPLFVMFSGSNEITNHDPSVGAFDLSQLREVSDAAPMHHREGRNQVQKLPHQSIIDSNRNQYHSNVKFGRLRRDGSDGFIMGNRVSSLGNSFYSGNATGSSGANESMLAALMATCENGKVVPSNDSLRTGYEA
mmetsp:Transcript_7329/g.10277  ORF Transcript_7329/g.10277 Transcript_7329/m.10277 type:complete len:152 (-) Transcript_7329:35-490(-)